MQVKRYEAANIREALAMIKKDLGPDAIVLSTKKMKGAKHPGVEVFAARDIHDVTESSAAGSFDGREEFLLDSGDPLTALRSEIGELKTLLTDARGVTALQGELAELKETIHTFFDVLGMRRSKEQTTGHLARIYYDLIGCGISKARAWKLMETVKKEFPAGGNGDYERSIRMVEDLMAKSIPLPAEKTPRKRVQVFVGPTGAGKTTTLAKLAARYALAEKLSVGLITTDTYRIAAAEQLKTYARIIGIPLAVATEKEAFQKALDGFSGKDIILIDTPGRSRRDEHSLRDLKDLLAVPVPREANLLLSLAASQENSMDAATRFGIFDYDHIIFTKLDECTRPGLLYDLVSQIGKPVSYVTNGQNVPQDIEKMNPVKLTKLAMGRGLHERCGAASLPIH